MIKRALSIVGIYALIRTAEGRSLIEVGSICNLQLLNKTKMLVCMSLIFLAATILTVVYCLFRRGMPAIKLTFMDMPVQTIF